VDLLLLVQVVVVDLVAQSLLRCSILVDTVKLTSLVVLGMVHMDVEALVAALTSLLSLPTLIMVDIEALEAMDMSKVVQVQLISQKRMLGLSFVKLSSIPCFIL